MSGRTLASALVLVVLAAPAAASAKGVEDARVCGAAGCEPAPLTADTYLVFEGGPSADPPAEAAPFYELRFGRMTGDGPEPEFVPTRWAFVPSAGLLRAEDGAWLRPDARAADALRRSLAKSEPFPAAELGLPEAEPEPAPAAAGDSGGIEPLPVIALVLLAGGAALAAGSRRRRGPAAG